MTDLPMGAAAIVAGTLVTTAAPLVLKRPCVAKRSLSEAAAAA